jgi:hypothetical protein
LSAADFPEQDFGTTAFRILGQQRLVHALGQCFRKTTSATALLPVPDSQSLPKQPRARPPVMDRHSLIVGLSASCRIAGRAGPTFLSGNVIVTTIRRCAVTVAGNSSSGLILQPCTGFGISPGISGSDSSCHSTLTTRSRHTATAGVKSSRNMLSRAVGNRLSEVQTPVQTTTQPSDGIAGDRSLLQFSSMIDPSRTNTETLLIE